MPLVAVELSECQSSYVRLLVARGSFVSEAQAVAALIENARLNDLASGLDALIDEGLASGPAEELTESDWASVRRLVRERVQRG
jgi:Arc/MetJ-type ribon-helix-helix transcriptional regulator